MIYLGKQAVGIADHRLANNILPYTYTSKELFKGMELPETLTLDYEDHTVSSMQEMFATATGIKTLTIKNLPKRDGGIYAMKAFNSSTIEEIFFENSVFAPSNSQRTFSSSCLKNIYGAIDMTYAMHNDMIYFSRVLENISFVPSTINTNMLLAGSACLTDYSFVQIANGLNEETTGCSLSISYYSEYKTRFNNILG